jgi:hypothetical protein
MNNEYGKPLIKVFPIWGKEFSLTFNKFPSTIFRLLCPKIALLQDLRTWLFVEIGLVGMGHGVWGMGHGAWGMGYGAWGMGHGAWQYCVGFGISWLRQALGAGGEMEAGVEFCLPCFPCLPCLPCKSYAVLPSGVPLA